MTQSELKEEFPELVNPEKVAAIEQIREILREKQINHLLMFDVGTPAWRGSWNFTDEGKFFEELCFLTYVMLTQVIGEAKKKVEDKNLVSPDDIMFAFHHYVFRKQNNGT